MYSSPTEDFYLHRDMYFPNPIKFSWEADSPADSYKLSLSQNADMSGAKQYSSSKSDLEINGLFTGAKYYWQVEANYPNRTCSSEVFAFETAPSPRTVRIDGVSNTRDIGGLKISGNRRIKQGLVYRGGKLNDATEEGKIYATEFLGIKTDIDLRNSAEVGENAVSPLGEKVNFININGPCYTGGGLGIDREDFKEALAQEVRLFANPDNYPIYVHCTLGRDRTGTIAIIIEGLLGAEKNELFLEYELSVFSVMGTFDNAGVDILRQNFNNLYAYIDGFGQKDTFAENVEILLRSLGITREEIDSIRNILTE